MPSGPTRGPEPDHRIRHPAGTTARASGNMIQLKFLTDDGTNERSLTLACGEQPQARMKNFGVTALSDTELIAMLLQGNGTKPGAAVAMASRLIAEAGSIAGLAAWAAADYQ